MGGVDHAAAAGILDGDYCWEQALFETCGMPARGRPWRCGLSRAITMTLSVEPRVGVAALLVQDVLTEPAWADVLTARTGVNAAASARAGGARAAAEGTESRSGGADAL